MKTSRTLVQVCILAVVLSAAGCSTQSKIRSIRSSRMTAQIQLPQKQSSHPSIETPEFRRDTLTVIAPDGGQLLIMHAIRDDESGEMVATEQLQAASVTARFRNVAERHGKVDISFQIVVPDSLQDKAWQIRFTPYMAVLGDTLALEPVLFTGRSFRKEQLRGYQLYERFLQSISRDSLYLIDRHQLEVFLERNYQEISDEAALEHYTNMLVSKWNESKIGRKDRVRRRLVRNPIITEGVRLDSVINAGTGALTIEYTQTVNTRPTLRKVDIILSGDISDARSTLYTMPRSAPLSFYISSLSTLTDDSPHYKTMIVERRAEANTACYIAFESAKSKINQLYSNNSSEITRIKENLTSLLENKDYDLDSIIVTASSSPEGRWGYNASLSQKRAEAVAGYFKEFMSSYADSLASERGIVLDENGRKQEVPRPDITLHARSVAENWQILDALVVADTTLPEKEKLRYLELRGITDPDTREAAMKKETNYRHFREHLYPRVRVTKFDFYLHRKGMAKDTIHTTVLDSLYMQGVKLIHDRDYEAALTILRPYSDYNTAVAFMSLDYNESAMQILKGLPATAEVDYMMALLHSRKGEHEKAVQYYMNACSKKQAFIHRGNLDPEISELIRLYGIQMSIE